MFDTPTVVGDLVYIASCSGSVSALDKESGAVHWTFDTAADGNRSTFHGDPLVTDSGIVYPADNGFVYAFDLETGELHWQTELPFKGVLDDAVTVGHTIVSANDKGGQLFALDLETGSHRWTLEPGGVLEGDNAASPVATEEGILFGGRDGLIYLVDPESGKVSWRLDLGVGPASELALVDGSLVVGLGDKRLVRIDLEARVIAGEVELPEVPDGTPAVVGQTVVLIAVPGWLVAVDTERDEIVWMKEGRWSSERPLVDGQTIVAGTWDGQLSAHRIGDGEVVWRDTLPGSVRGIGMSGETYFIGTSQGTIYAYRPLDRVSIEDLSDP